MEPSVYETTLMATGGDTNTPVVRSLAVYIEFRAAFTRARASL